MIERRLAYSLAGACLFACLSYVATAVLAFPQQNELVAPALSRPIGAEHTIALEFTARTPLLGKLYAHAPISELERCDQEAVRIELVDPASQSVLQTYAGTLSDVMFFGHISLAYAPGWPLTEGQRYQLRFTLPLTAEDDGLRFFTTRPAEDWGDRLLIDGSEQPGLTMNYLMLGAPAALPLPLLMTCAVLMAWSFWRAETHGHIPVLLFTVGAAAVLSEFIWARQLWIFWGEYWPDGYPAFANRIYLWLTGASSFEATREYAAHYRNGHNFVVPLLMAVLHRLHVPYILGYVATAVAGCTGALALLGIAGRKSWRLSHGQCAWLIILAGSQLVILRSFARPSTDGSGVFFAVLFAAAFSLSSRSRSWSNPWMWVAALAACLGVLTRIALAPLLVVPLAVLGWRVVVLRERTDRATWFAPVIVSVSAIAMLAGTLTVLQLWDAVIAARRFAALPQFTADFSPAAFARCTIIGLQFALPLALLRTRRLLTDDRTVPLLAAVVGFELMLYVGHVAAWERYWAPIAPLACGIVAILLFDTGGFRRPWQLTVLVVSIASNLALIAARVGH